MRRQLLGPSGLPTAALVAAGVSCLVAGTLLSLAPGPLGPLLSTVLGAFGGLLLGAAFGRVLAGHIRGARRPAPTALPPRDDETSAQGSDERPAREAPFDMDGLLGALAMEAEPLEALKAIVVDVRRREGVADGLFSEDDGDQAPLPLELYLSRELEDAGLMGAGDATPPVAARINPRSGCVRLLMGGLLVDYGESLRILRIESALNRALFADRRLGADPPGAVGAYDRFAASVEASLVAQVAYRGGTDGARGEWALRRAVAEGIERFQLPYRLDARFRANAGAGVVAFSLPYTPADAMAPRTWFEGAGRAVSATESMRGRAAAALACRKALLVAFHGVLCSPEVSEVWVECVEDTPAGHGCLLWAKMGRDDLLALDPRSVGDPVEALLGLGAAMDWDGRELMPVEPGFTLDDPVLCPAWRAAAPEASDRPIPAAYQHALGARRTRDLSFDGSPGRMAAAESIARSMGGSTADNVSLVNSVAAMADDPLTRAAARRSVERLVDGSLGDDDGLALIEEFAAADWTARAMEQVPPLLEQGDLEGAVRLVERAVARVEDALGEDGRARCFAGYAARSVYNRLVAPEGEHVVLAPRSLLTAHLFLATAHGRSGDHGAALAHAFAARDLDPLDPQAALCLANAYEALGDVPMAFEALRDLLRWALTPEVAVLGHYRLAHLAWESGEPRLAYAAYHRAATAGTPQSVFAALEMTALEASEEFEAPAPDEVGQVLAAHGFGESPAPEVSRAVLEAAEAATDAEVFAAARDLATLAGVLSGDDVMRDVARSIEADLDR